MNRRLPTTRTSQHGGDREPPFWRQHTGGCSGESNRPIYRLAILLGLAAEASAAVKIIEKIYFDPPGADTGSNSSLNHEYVVIKNTEQPLLH